VRRWLFADQLGPHFLDEPHQPAFLVESKAVFRRRAYHRQKAHDRLRGSPAWRRRSAEWSLNDLAAAREQELACGDDPP
jgi:deoxyribodipyrimidine photolyase-related protein